MGGGGARGGGRGRESVSEDMKEFSKTTSLTVTFTTHRWDGILCGFWSIVSAKVSHGAALGCVHDPHPLEHLPGIQVIELARAVLLVILP